LQATGDPLDPKREIKKYFQVGKADVTSGVTSSKIFFDEADIRKVKVGRFLVASSRRGSFS
jgi:ATP-dependent DNA helicase 2 subunit 1